MTTPDDTRERELIPPIRDALARLGSLQRIGNGVAVAQVVLAALRDSGWVDPDEAARRLTVTNEIIDAQHEKARKNTVEWRQFRAEHDKTLAERDALLPVVEAARAWRAQHRTMVDWHELDDGAIRAHNALIAAVDAWESREESTDGR